jgi:hypothetical protein
MVVTRARASSAVADDAGPGVAEPGEAALEGGELGGSELAVPGAVGRGAEWVHPASAKTSTMREPRRVTVDQHSPGASLVTAPRHGRAGPLEKGAFPPRSASRQVILSALAWYSRSFTKYDRTWGVAIPDPSSAASVRALSKTRFDQAYGM